MVPLPAFVVSTGVLLSLLLVYLFSPKFLRLRMYSNVTRSAVFRTGLVAVIMCSCLTVVFLHEENRQPPPPPTDAPYIVHAEVKNSHCKQCALVFTPYHLTPGGGENFLLKSVSLLQKIGYVVDLMVQEHNQCQNLDCVKTTASFLRVPLDYTKLNFLVGRLWNRQLPLRHEYDVFFLLGNEKTPELSNPARLGIYMCQFPFDLDQQISQEQAKRLSSYHHVWLNSQYTLRWYTRFILPTLKLLNSMGSAKTSPLLWPNVNVVYPPVNPLIPASSVLPDDMRSGVLMIGRFFAGRQSKGHDFAIKVFRNMITSSHAPPGVELTLIGSLMPGHEAHLDYLKRLAAGLPVQFLVDCPAEQLMHVANRASVFWHMTGINQTEEEDPASIEHFGMSVVEAMTSGVIPVVMNIGGTAEIVDSTCGRLAISAMDFIVSTLDIFGMPTSERQNMRNAAVHRASMFSFSRFISQGERLVVRGLLELKFRDRMHLIPVNDGLIASLSNRSPYWPWGKGRSYAAVIVEHRPHWALERICKNMLSNLLPLWDMYVYHSEANADFVKHIFSGFPHVRLRLNTQTEQSVAAYNRLLTSSSFWSPLQSYDRVLIFQVDSFLVRPLPSKFLVYDYVGAPWCDNNELAKQLIMGQEITEFVGNGGLSLRNPAEMMTCINRASKYDPTVENEDVFFIKCLSQNRKRIAPFSVASEFAVEVPCNGSANIGKVHGVHANWYYMSDNEYARFLQEQTVL